MGQFKKRIQQRHAEKEASKRWAPFQEVDLQKATAKIPKGLIRAYMNNLFSVQVFERETPIGVVMLAGLRAHVETASRLMTWRVKQRIKNEIFGAERAALEVYPPESELVNAADMYWLWIMPEGERLPFNLRAIVKNQPEPSAKKISMIGGAASAGRAFAAKAIDDALHQTPNDIADTIAGDPPNVHVRLQAAIAEEVTESSVAEKIVDQAANDEVKTKRARTKKIAE